jgi:chemotaxis protein methyltransferase CheR
MSKITLTQLNDFITKRMGLRFSKERCADLERGITSAARDFGYSDSDSCIEWLLSSKPSKSQVEILASHLTVGETYFFREERVFYALEDRILKDLIEQRRNTERRLRIWSAGCSTGEEPYSIAILLSKILPDLQDWHITILATDINPRSLKMAAAGVYSNWSFRDCPEWVKERFFIRTENNRYEILPDIKKMVTFQYHNLCEDPYPSLLNNTNAMDIILCRNVLMYFAPDKAKKVIHCYQNCLTDGGWLIVSPCEVSMVSHPQMVPIAIETGITLYKKEYERRQAKEENTVNETFNLSSYIAPYMDISTCQYNKSDMPNDLLADIKSESHMEEPDKYEQASVLYKQGYYAEAELILKKLLSENQDKSEMMVMLSRTYANQGKLQDATEWCRKAIAKDKLNPSYHYLLAIIMQESGQLIEAATSLKHAIFLSPKFVPAHFALGMLIYQQGKLKESYKYLENVLSLLKNYRQEDMLPETELTAGRLTEIVRSIIKSEKLYEPG